MWKANVFNRTQVQGTLVSDATYNFVIGFVLLWGFFVNWLIVRYVDTAWITSISPWIIFCGYLSACFLGIFLFNSSSNPALSFLGYNWVVVPFGFMVNLMVSRYSSTLVLEAIQVTGMVTIVMMAMGTLFPGFFKNIFSGLAISLLAVIIIESVQIFFFHKHSTWLDWAVVTIFCGYIGFDWARANGIPKTIDNAVDSAAAIYMDIINLFLRILRILGRRRR